MEDDKLRAEIQAAYSRLLAAKGYGPRHCQKSMIAAIARTLGAIPAGDAGPDGGNICVIEAGTGTGKTIAYALAAIPIARQLKKKVVIATATVALQEQIIYRDLPDIRQHTGLDFSLALAKGRGRYLCLSRLEQALAAGDTMNLSLPLLAGDAADTGDGRGAEVFAAIGNALGHRRWDGDRDNWPEEIDPGTWARVSADYPQCPQRHCHHYDDCYFYRAREKVYHADCIVANQDLVLADLMMGGGAVLPAPEDTIYIFDEGHHLPGKAGNHFAHSLSIAGAGNWLGQVPALLQPAMKQFPDLKAIEPLLTQAGGRLDEAAAVLQTLQQEATADNGGWLYRFPQGRVSGEVARLAAGLGQFFERMEAVIDKQVAAIEAALEETPVADRGELEQWLADTRGIAWQLSADVALWRNFSEEQLTPPWARWISYAAEGADVQLHSHPVSVAEELRERLWSRCAGAVVTSGTLSVAQDFTHFQNKSGISPDELFVSLESPFRFRDQAVLQVPGMNSDPKDADAHTREVTALIPELVCQDPGALVLFTSRRQMQRVCEGVDEEFRDRVLMQGDLSKMEILSRHRERIDKGESSCIFGLASFAEGVDLPGDYCRHVVIAKLPFAVPGHPVGATLSEWVRAQGGNPFYDIMLPDAVLGVVQAAGRLLRTETDSGRVTILDRRVVLKPYGRLFLDALPPFTLAIH